MRFEKMLNDEKYILYSTAYKLYYNVLFDEDPTFSFNDFWDCSGNKKYLNFVLREKKLKRIIKCL